MRAFEHVYMRTSYTTADLEPATTVRATDLEPAKIARARLACANSPCNHKSHTHRRTAPDNSPPRRRDYLSLGRSPQLDRAHNTTTTAIEVHKLVVRPGPAYSRLSHREFRKCPPCC